MIGRSNSKRSLFFAVFVSVFLAALITSLFNKFSRPKTYVCVTTLSLQSAGQQRLSDPYVFPTESRVIRSEAVLAKVVESLDLNTKWSKNYNAGMPFRPEETINRLNAAFDLCRREGPIEIAVSDEDPQEAAQIAKAIATCYHDFRMKTPWAINLGYIQVANTTEPAIKAVWPAKPLEYFLVTAASLTLGALAGLLAYGIVAVRRQLFAWEPCVGLAVKVVGWLWIGISSLISLVVWILVVRFISFGDTAGVLACSRAGVFWTTSSIAGFLLIRGNMWAKIYIFVAAVAVTLPLPITGSFLLLHPLRWDLVVFGIGTICSLLLPQQLKSPDPEEPNKALAQAP